MVNKITFKAMVKIVDDTIIVNCPDHMSSNFSIVINIPSTIPFASLLFIFIVSFIKFQVTVL